MGEGRELQESRGHAGRFQTIPLERQLPQRRAPRREAVVYAREGVVVRQELHERGPPRIAAAVEERREAAARDRQHFQLGERREGRPAAGAQRVPRQVEVLQRGRGREARDRAAARDFVIRRVELLQTTAAQRGKRREAVPAELARRELGKRARERVREHLELVCRQVERPESRRGPAEDLDHNFRHLLELVLREGQDARLRRGLGLFSHDARARLVGRRPREARHLGHVVAHLGLAATHRSRATARCELLPQSCGALGLLRLALELAASKPTRSRRSGATDLPRIRLI
mmetsp:Transcript_29794/g.89647  ORF Transcript_29794/g.89647 Transcript_29794/m.89647 type:complete len:289 (+) Transcript_29794:143-1009(+)